ncbi:MAG: MFS transporter, partial [SAR202 cluster bacterium]|nr:MFS transporter [SAR202 cluster bacterium]
MGVSTRRGPRFFYGWVIAGVMAVVGGWTLSMGGANFGFFISPMRDELGFDRAFFGWASTARLYGGALGGIYIGRLLDVRGPRFVLALFGGIGAALVASLGFVSAEWQLIFIFGVIGLLGMQGSANIYTSAIVAKWFVRRRTRAMALMYLGVPTTLIVAFPLTQLLIDQLGWRGAWATLGLVGVAIIVPSSLLLLRREPEDMGLRPDGDPPARPRVAEPG